MKTFAEMTLDEIIREGGWDCECCGRHHEAGLKYLKVERGAVRYLPEALERCGVKKPLSCVITTPKRPHGRR